MFILFMILIIFININNVKTAELRCSEGFVEIKSSNTKNYKEGQCVREKDLLANLKEDQEVKLTNNKTCRAASVLMPAACTLYRSNAISGIDICFNPKDFTPVLERKNITTPTTIIIQHIDNEKTQKTYQFAENESKIEWPLDDFPIEDNKSYMIQQNEQTMIKFTFFVDSSAICEEEIILEKKDSLTSLH